MRDALIDHVASGQAYFAGAVLLSLAVLLEIRTAAPRASALARTVVACTGLLLIALSATPLPVSFYAAGASASLAWLAAEESKSSAIRRLRPWLRGGVLAVWWLGVAVELPYHVVPSVPRSSGTTLSVVGDSLSAGTGGEGMTWPRRLARDHGLDVRDLSVAGATVATAARDQARRASERGGVVLVEIGGNDLLSGTPPRAFERSLDELLTRLRAGGRTVVMLELPLPPFFNHYGAIQRRQARRHGVLLVPKRVLLGILTTRGATTDTIHLSPAGHAVMAEAVWDVLRTAFSPPRPEPSPRS